MGNGWFWIGLDKDSPTLPAGPCQNTACIFDWLNVDPPATFREGPDGYFVQGQKGKHNYVYADGALHGKLQILLDYNGNAQAKVLCEYRCEPGMVSIFTKKSVDLDFLQDGI